MTTRKLCWSKGMALIVGLSWGLNILAGPQAIKKSVIEHRSAATITTKLETPRKAEGVWGMAHEGAGHPRGSVTLVDVPIANDGAAAGMLREAYAALAVGDHDYGGHRVKAMKEIEEAAKHLGISLHGDGRGHQAQGTSDMRLRNAQGLLAQASGALRGRGLRHVQLAMEQVNVALQIR